MDQGLAWKARGGEAGAKVDALMEESPFGPIVDVGNARDQYLYLRGRLKQH